MSTEKAITELMQDGRTRTYREVYNELTSELGYGMKVSYETVSRCIRANNHFERFYDKDGTRYCRNRVWWLPGIIRPIYVYIKNYGDNV